MTDTRDTGPSLADLFHGFDPVSGNPNKVLTVRYSFDGKEATITRPEYAWLILPEDKYLRDKVEACRLELEGFKSNIPKLKLDLGVAERGFRSERDSRQDCERQLAQYEELFTPLQLEAFQLARELREFLKNMGPRPVVDISGDKDADTLEKIRKINAVVQPWLARLINTYRADFEDRVNKIVVRLAAENLRDFALDAATTMPNNEKTILDIVELLPLLAVKLDFADGRKALKRET